MSDGFTLLEYFEYVNHLYMQMITDYAYLDGGSTPDALTVIGD